MYSLEKTILWIEDFLLGVKTHLNDTFLHNKQRNWSGVDTCGLL